MDYVYALFNPVTKEYQTSSGYYGNECNIHCFETKEAAEKHIKMYGVTNCIAKKMNVKR